MLGLLQHILCWVVDVVQENNIEAQENGIVLSLINGYREVW